jgi:hypothetical protein
MRYLALAVLLCGCTQIEEGKPYGSYREACIDGVIYLETIAPDNSTYTVKFTADSKVVPCEVKK